jgi:chaperone required for assembly of F1-ATPase
VAPHDAEAVKRFYREVAVTPDLGIALDGRPVKTPARVPLSLPTRTLADAVAAEWAAQGDDILPRTMPLTGLANAAIDRVMPDPAAFAASLAAYADADALLYRADGPGDLVRRQAAAWNPLLDWAERRYSVEFVPVAGVMHRPQPPETLAVLGSAIAAFPPFRLVAMQPLVTISGSLVAALALAERAFDEDTVWAAAALDELYQAEKWGEDDLAAAARANRRADFAAAARFLALAHE